MNRRYKCDVCKQYCAAFLTDRTRVLGFRERGIFICLGCLRDEVQLFNDGNLVAGIPNEQKEVESWSATEIRRSIAERQGN